MKAKVCMFVWNNFTNDARVIREATALTEAGYDVSVIAIFDSNIKGLQKEDVINGFIVHRVDQYGVLAKSGYIFKKLFIFKAYFIFRVFIQMIIKGLNRNYDIYHSHDLNTLLQGFICKLIKKKKLIYDSHEVATSRTGYKGRKYFYLERYLVKKIDKMIMTDDTRADYTVNLYGIERPCVLHNYPFYSIPDKEAISLNNLLNIPKNEPILLYQGGIQEGRGIEQIVKAIPHFKRGITVFIGDGKLKNSIIKMCEDMKLTNRVRFLKTVPVNELLNYTCNAYIGFQVLQNVCFNHYSTTSNKLFEYLMAEVPIVASNFPEIRKVVEFEQIGVCIDPHSIDNIINAVNYLLDNPTEYQTKKSNCKNAKNKYKWENEKNLLLNLYEKL